MRLIVKRTRRVPRLFATTPPANRALEKSEKPNHHRNPNNNKS